MACSLSPSIKSWPRNHTSLLVDRLGHGASVPRPLGCLGSLLGHGEYRTNLFPESGIRTSGLQCQPEYIYRLQEASRYSGGWIREGQSYCSSSFLITDGSASRPPNKDVSPQRRREQASPEGGQALSSLDHLSRDNGAVINKDPHVQLDSSLFEHWGWEDGAGEAESGSDVSLIGGDQSNFGPSLLEGLSDPHPHEIHPSTREQTNAITSRDDGEAVENPSSWLFSPMVNHVTHLCQAKNRAMANEAADTCLDLDDFFAWLLEKTNLLSEADSRGISSQAGPSTNQLPGYSQPRTPAGGCDILTSVAPFPSSHPPNGKSRAARANYVPVIVMLAKRKSSPARTAALAPKRSEMSHGTLTLYTNARGGTVRSATNWWTTDLTI
ncbi:hypothetical protein CONLIGDRAFT_668932 [Coniochaeta ligniaria NRRL 30616]|uniref:Uncharacterized protein n=1 Tax=Coniochaeta ligniaria NRRL 30616 TaxID=1408157 RepID=A0A1J7JTP2_9PEZI|nr:hypothetical protein CONLIGDRAFT_668932 [Coniochaeta ligniaria NRRL 30616]